ncbi:Oligoribonuclease, mitochondrial [Borealophlyctis nickersoniae]|nr:Oligoribonuclease, mitochondrial [Borealophlyctis nickersoniae]
MADTSPTEKLNVKLTQPLVWIDIETTGLDVQKNSIMEVACIITDGQLDKVVRGPNLIINLPDEKLLKMDEWSWKQHGKSGLTQLCREKGAVKIDKAEELLLKFVKDYVPERKVGILAGSSVHFDKEFIRKEMPKVYDHLHYRIVDVSTIGELVRRWYPDVLRSRPGKRGDHRAMDDIEDSVRELQFYKALVFKDPLEENKVKTEESDITIE